MRQTKENSELVKDIILEKAAEEFARKGFQGTNLKDITTAAGISRGPLYYRFKDKKELFAATVHKLIVEQRETYEHVLGQKGHILDILRQEYTQCLNDSNTLLQIMRSQKELLELEEFRQFDNWLYQRKLEIFTAARSCGELRGDCDPNEIVTFQYIFYNGLMHVRESRDSGFSLFNSYLLDQSVDAFLEIVKARYCLA